MKQGILSFIFALLLLMGVLAARPVTDAESVAAANAAAAQTTQTEAVIRADATDGAACYQTPSLGL